MWWAIDQCFHIFKQPSHGWYDFIYSISELVCPCRWGGSLVPESPWQRPMLNQRERQRCQPLFNPNTLPRHTCVHIVKQCKSLLLPALPDNVCSLVKEWTTQCSLCKPEVTMVLWSSTFTYSCLLVYIHFPTVPKIGDNVQRWANDSVFE